MTKIRYSELNHGCYFSAEGHAGYAAKGRDIVCAAVSALCISLLRRLEEMSLAGIVQLTQCDIADGALTLVAETEDGDKLSELRLRDTFETVLAGLQALEEKYGQYVEVD